ncbi:Hypothetical predicted protein [Mytilus galloprovincialis]|uniref:B box-type domain-containing protein n=2 Tax=Mytilus galloprovincialis TaxID=29158 RepID=A0A8B6EFK6_MYTGA|nr:Hypothetical predicted protein [Mytilus galloprovincialis]
MSTDPKICNICDSRHITKQATDWCSECEQAFCNDCKEYHAFSRLTKTHTTIPISDFLSLEPSFSAISSVCAEHTDIYQMFCPQHDKLLCLKCLAKHDDCKGIVPLSEITKTVKGSANFQETQHGFTDIIENITKIQNELKLSLETTNDEEKILMSEIGKMRRKIDDHLDKLEDNFRTDLTKETAESRKAIELLLQKLDSRKSETIEHLQQMKDLETHASEFQTYLGLRQLAFAMESTESFVQSVAKDGNLEIDAFSLNFDDKINETVSSIQQFGIVQVQKKACHLALCRQKDKQAQRVGMGQPLIMSINDIELKLVQTIDTRCNQIGGCEILPDGKMVFSNGIKDGHAVILDTDGTYLFDILKKSNTYCVDITCIDNNNKLAISHGFGSKEIDIVEINKPQEEQKTITTENACHGLAYTNNSILCYINQEGIKKISLDNYKVSTIVKADLTFGYIAVFNNKLYYTDRDENVVTCCDMAGQILWTFSDESVLNEPWGIAVDVRGFVYVVCNLMNIVVVLSPDGQDKRVLLTNIDGLKSPRVLHYDKLRDRLLVVNEETHAFLFDISAKQ